MSLLHQPSRAVFFLALAVALVAAFAFRMYRDYRTHSRIGDIHKLFMVSSLVNLVSAIANDRRSQVKERRKA